MTLLTDLEEFIRDHRPNGALTADATPPPRNGHLLTRSVRLRVGVWDRLVPLVDATADLMRTGCKRGGLN